MDSFEGTATVCAHGRAAVDVVPDQTTSMACWNVHPRPRCHTASSQRRLFRSSSRRGASSNCQALTRSNAGSAALKPLTSRTPVRWSSTVRTLGGIRSHDSLRLECDREEGRVFGPRSRTSLRRRAGPRYSPGITRSTRRRSPGPRRARCRHRFGRGCRCAHSLDGCAQIRCEGIALRAAIGSIGIT